MKLLWIRTQNGEVYRKERAGDFVLQNQTSTLRCLNTRCRITWEYFKRFNFATEIVMNF